MEHVGGVCEAYADCSTFNLVVVVVVVVIVVFDVIIIIIVIIIISCIKKLAKRSFNITRNSSGNEISERDTSTEAFPWDDLRSVCTEVKGWLRNAASLPAFRRELESVLFRSSFPAA